MHERFLGKGFVLYPAMKGMEVQDEREFLA